MNKFSNKILDLKDKWFIFAPSIKIKDNGWSVYTFFLKNIAEFNSARDNVYNVLLRVVKDKGFDTLVGAFSNSTKEEQEKIFDEAYRLAKLWAFS
jgi:hypothetical protein